MKFLLGMLFPLALFGGQKIDVVIVGRHSFANSLTKVVPGTSSTSANAQVTCVPIGILVNCNGSSTSKQTTIPSQQYNYNVNGTVLALDLPDGRIAFVGCAWKTGWSRARSCREPITNKIQVEFKSKGVKLFWPISMDGSKKSSETYQLMGFLTKEEYAAQGGLR